MNISNLRDTIIPKSDQLNADDLIGCSRTITITGVTRGNNESPLNIHYEGDDNRPFKPCKTMRRLLIAAWGEDGNNWIGKSATLFTDPDVKYAGKNVGGIRISHLSDIKKRFEINLTATRGSKKLYTIDVLQPTEKPPYPEDKFNAGFEAMKAQIQGGKMTTEQVINRCEASGKLNEQQRQMIRELDESEE